MGRQSPLPRESRTSYRSRAGERHSHNTSTEPSRHPDKLLERFYKGRSGRNNRTDYSPRNRSPPSRHQRAQPADSAFPQQRSKTSHRRSLSSDSAQRSSQGEISVATDVSVSRHDRGYHLHIWKRTCGSDPEDDQPYGSVYETPMPLHKDIDRIFSGRSAAEGTMTVVPSTEEVQFQFYGKRIGDDEIEVVDVTRELRGPRFDELYRWAREPERPSLFKSHFDGTHSNDRF